MTSELLDDILLSTVEGIGARTYRRLLEQFGSATAILNASRSELRGFDFLKKETLDRLLTARDHFDPTVILQWCDRAGIDIVSSQDPRYPASLHTIHDPPPILYIKGRILPRDALSLAVIGTRRSTTYGRRQAERLGTAIARSGLTVVSGLALGIDSVAHRAALDAGGRTLAVLGSGHGRLYPPENESLANRIAESGGAVLSEFPPLHPSAKWTFPQRNRIVSGLALGVLVIEAPLRSGAMITARMAAEQGRDMFAVPGPIDSEASRGCNQLIRDGACLVESVDDILEVLGPMTQPIALPQEQETLRHPAEITLNEVELAVLHRIGTSPTALDMIVERSGFSESQIQAALSVLEAKRLIRQTEDGAFLRV